MNELPNRARLLPVEAAINVGSPVYVTHKTFTCCLPELERYLAEDAANKIRDIRSEVIGCEVLPPEEE